MHPRHETSHATGLPPRRRRSCRSRAGHLGSPSDEHSPLPPRYRLDGDDDDVARLVADARDGSEHAWAELVRRYDSSLRQLARSYRLCASDVDDVVQTAWVQLFRHLDQLRDGAAVRAWLFTTARRECLRACRGRAYEVLTDAIDREDPDNCDPPAEVIAGEQRVALVRALGVLPVRHRRLIELLISDECSSYEDVSARLGMPVGSIGPIRARSLARLGRHAELRAFQT